MKLSSILAATAVICVAVFGCAGSASAQATRTFVSALGDDANPCSRTAPCRTFAGTISKTATGGEINCIDPGSFGTVTIAKSITIACKDVAGQTASTTTGIIINPPAGSVIRLQGLSITGAPSALPGYFGIRIVAPASVLVQDCDFAFFTAASPNGYGIRLTPATGATKLVVRNSTFVYNGAATSGAGIEIAPTGVASVDVSIDGALITGNYMGLRAVSTETTGVIKVAIANSELSGSVFHGIVAVGDNGPVNVVVKNTQLIQNAGIGIRAVGANTIVRVGSSAIVGNLTGLATVSGADLRSYGDNMLNGNVTDGAFTGPVALQ